MLGGNSAWAMSSISENSSSANARGGPLWLIAAIRHNESSCNIHHILLNPKKINQIVSVCCAGALTEFCRDTESVLQGTRMDQTRGENADDVQLADRCKRLNTAWFHLMWPTSTRTWCSPSVFVPVESHVVGCFLSVCLCMVWILRLIPEHAHTHQTLSLTSHSYSCSGPTGRRNIPHIFWVGG